MMCGQRVRECPPTTRFRSLLFKVLGPSRAASFTFVFFFQSSFDTCKPYYFSDPDHPRRSAAHHASKVSAGLCRMPSPWHPTRRHWRVVTLGLRPAPKRLTRQRTRECGDVTSRLHSDVRRQPHTLAHHRTVPDNDRPPLELAVACHFVGRKVRKGAHARTIPQ